MALGRVASRETAGRPAGCCLRPGTTAAHGEGQDALVPRMLYLGGVQNFVQSRESFCGPTLLCGVSALQKQPLGTQACSACVLTCLHAWKRCWPSVRMHWSMLVKAAELTSLWLSRALSCSLLHPRHLHLPAFLPCMGSWC